MTEHLDEDGYPTEQCLATITDWPVTDFDGLVEFIAPLWRYENYFETVVVERTGIRRVCASTGGWSGNESIIAALPDMWRFFHFVSHHRGGHWVFERSYPKTGVEIGDGK